MKLLEGTWQAALWVSLTLVVALAGAGAASSAYRRERQKLGQSHFRAGEALAAANQDQGAVEQYRKALLFEPDSPRYRLALATAVLQGNHLDEAESYLEQLLDEDPANPLIYVRLAQVALKRKQVSRAILEFQRAVYQYWPPDIVPLRRETRWQLVALLNAAGRRSEASGELLQLYASSPADPVEKDRIGYALLRNGAASEAGRIFTDVARQYPHDMAAVRGLARVQFAGGNYVEARHLFQRALRADARDTESQQGFALTNAVIEMDGSSERIGQGERIRRDANLLRRVLTDLGKCTGENEKLAAEAEAAQMLLTAKHPNTEDIGFEYQQTAQQLWTEAVASCGPNAPDDPAVERILGGNHE